MPKIANFAYRDLEIRARGHSRSLILVPMESACTHSYHLAISCELNLSKFTNSCSNRSTSTVKLNWDKGDLD